MGKFRYNLGVGKGFLTMTKNPDVINLRLTYLTTQKQTFAWQKQKQTTIINTNRWVGKIFVICLSSIVNILKYKQLIKTDQIKAKICLESRQHEQVINLKM